MEIKNTAQLHNKFEITVCDAETGEEKQKGYAYNVILDQYFSMRLNKAGRENVGTSGNPNYLCVGTGEGTPAITDTDLFTRLFQRESSVLEEHYEYPTSYIVRQIKINADEYNDETFTEVGLAHQYRAGIFSSINYWVCTHAMIEDSEGTPMPITKTDTDVVYIKSIFYCTFVQTGVGTNALFPAASDNAVVKWLLTGDYENYIYTSPFEAESASDVITDYAYYQSFSWGDGSGDMDTLTWSLPTVTILDSYYNNHLIKNIVFQGIGGFQFPDTSIFPEYSIDHLVIGEGDGETTQFNIQCPSILSDDIHVYVGSVEIPASSYDIDCESNCSDTWDNYYTANMRIKDNPYVKFGNPSFTGSYVDPMYWGHNNVSYCTYSQSVTEADPIWIDFQSPKGCNKLKLYLDGSLSDTYLAKLKIQYSDNNVVWNDVEYTYTSTAPGYGRLYDFVFEITTAQYWRVFIADTTWSYHNWYYSTSVSSRDNVSGMRSSFALGKSVPGLTLHTAPDPGESVEISYNINVPYKTANNLIRLTCSIALQRGAEV